MKRKIKVPAKGMQTRASFSPGSYDEESRTIEVVFSTGSKGKRGVFTEYFEELSMKKSDVRLDRFNKGAPVLDNHSRSNGLKGVIGVVEKAFIKNKQGIAVVRFSDREDVQGIVRDIQNGIIRNVSVGYKVHKYEDVSKRGDEIPTFRATDWEPMELSFVDIPFDMDAQARSLDDCDAYEITIEENEETQMNREKLIREACAKAGLSDEVAAELISREFDINELDTEIKRALEAANETQETETETQPETQETETEERAEEQPETQEINLDEERKVAAKLERERCNEIRSIATSLGLGEKVASEHIEKETSLENFRSFAIKQRAELDKIKPTQNHNIEVNDMDQRQARMMGAENALLNKFNRKNELTEAGRDFRFVRLVDVARKFLEAESVNTSGMSSNDIAERSLHSSSDFKEVLANVANKSLRDAYEMAPQTFSPIVREVSVPDFKEISRVQLHSGAGLSEVGENGEYEHTTLSESAEKYSIQEYGKIIGITRKTLINDDLGAFTRVPAQMGMKARSLESKLVWAIINSNPQMADGNALFSAAHGNLAGSGAAISVATVNAGMSAMMLQTDADGELIDVMPNFLVGPSILAANIKQFLGATAPNSDGEVNPFKGDLDPIIERRLDAGSQTAWYLMASAAMLDMIEIARLDGQDGPVISQQDGFDVSGMKLKVQYDFGAKVLDWRGFYKNPGA